MSTENPIAVTLEFRALYEVRLPTELPRGTGQPRQFARAERITDGGVVIEVATVTERWVGLVANATESVRDAHSGIFSTPSGTTLCVVARGDAYFIDAHSPGRWWVLDDSPVVAVRSARDEGLLVLATRWRLVAVGADGVVWRTARLAIDGIEIGEPAGGRLEGVADPGDDESRAFVVDLKTGSHSGGFSFSEE